MKIAILDDYQSVAANMPAMERLAGRVDVRAFTDHLSDQDALAVQLEPFDCIIAMRERTPLPGALLERLPRLRLLITTGMANVAIDLVAATELGIQVCGTASLPYPTVELTWALILTLVRRIPQETAALRDGRWQVGLGGDLNGRTLGIIGLGKLGTRVAHVANAFSMNVLAWSTNLTGEQARERGASRVEFDELLAQSDVVTIHSKLSERTRGLIGQREFGLMKPSAFLVNTSRGPIIDETALIEALQAGHIAGAALDVYEQEPLPAGHPLLQLPNLLATPHIGYVTQANYETYFREAVEDIEAWLDGRVLRPLNTPSDARSPGGAGQA
jgi:phosphoglycerate dehydrogenase-like enzyme